MDKYCTDRIEEGLGFCRKVNMKIPKMFCLYTCMGNWKKHFKENIEVSRLEMRKPIENVDGLVTVIIPSRDEPKEHLEFTVKSLYDNALGDIEVFVCYDGCEAHNIPGTRVFHHDKPVGQRVIMNELARYATGKYLFRQDAHCAMSEGWDARLKASCRDKTLVTCVFDSLDDDLQRIGKDNAFYGLKPNMSGQFIRNWKKPRDRKLEEETMSISGTAWMITKDYYNQMGGSDESLGVYGSVGSEWALKTWLTGGKVLIRTDTVCYHLFRNNTPYPVDVNKKAWASSRLHELWVEGVDERRTRPIEWLLCKFNRYTKWRPHATLSV